MLKCARIKCKISHKSPLSIVSISLCIFYYISLKSYCLPIATAAHHFFYLLYYLLFSISSITLNSFNSSHFYYDIYLSFHSITILLFICFLFRPIFSYYTLPSIPPFKISSHISWFTPQPILNLSIINSLVIIYLGKIQVKNLFYVI